LGPFSLFYKAGNVRATSGRRAAKAALHTKDPLNHAGEKLINVFPAMGFHVAVATSYGRTTEYIKLPRRCAASVEKKIYRGLLYSNKLQLC